MRTFQILSAALCAVLAFAVVVASLAFGDATHLWLINGGHITGTESVPALAEGEMLMEEMKSGIKILCSGRGVGTLLSEGKDEIILIEDLSGNDVEGSSNTLSVSCNFDTESGSTGSCEGVSPGSLVAVFPLNLPWKTELVLVGAMWVDLGSGITGTPGGLIECTILGIKGDISCTGATSFVGGGLVENETGGILAEAEPENEEVTPAVKCSTPLGEGQGLVFNDVAGLGTSSSGTLSISEP